MQSKAKTVNQYIKEMPKDRQVIVKHLRSIILKNLPKGFEENMNWGMITYEVPLKVEPNTYNGQPLMYAALANQKNFVGLYFMSIYSDPKLIKIIKDEEKKLGRKLLAGKCCIHIKKIDDMSEAAVKKLVKSFTMKKYIEHFHKTYSRGRNKK